jgi:GR25 family glycosyltransferase involved in LPS biosynthesis
VINLERRPDRLQKFESQPIPYQVKLFRAIDGQELRNGLGQLQEENQRRNNELACKLSHMRLLRYAHQQHMQGNGHEMIMVFEDDAELLPGWQGYLERAMQELPDGWHMLYLGVNNINPAEIFSNHLKKITTGFTTHAYIIHSRAYLLAMDALDNRGQVDVLYADHIHTLGKSFCCRDQVAGQREGMSDITLNHEKYIMRN